MSGRVAAWDLEREPVGGANRTGKAVKATRERRRSLKARISRTGPSVTGKERTKQLVN